MDVQSALRPTGTTSYDESVASPQSTSLTGTKQPASKQAILDAAEEILSRSGYAGLSMRELSRESGLAKSTLYHYFQDKHDIYLSVLERDMIALNETLRAAANIDGDPVERMRSVIITHFRLLEARGDIAFQAIRRAGKIDDDLCDLFRKHRNHVVEPITDILQQGIDEGVFRPVDPQLTILSIFGMVNGFYAQRSLFGETDPDLVRIGDEDVVEHTLSLLFNGICT